MFVFVQVLHCIDEMFAYQICSCTGGEAATVSLSSSKVPLTLTTKDSIGRIGNAFFRKYLTCALKLVVWR